MVHLRDDPFGLELELTKIFRENFQVVVKRNRGFFAFRKLCRALLFRYQTDDPLFLAVDRHISFGAVDQPLGNHKGKLAVCRKPPGIVAALRNPVDLLYYDIRNRYESTKILREYLQIVVNDKRH